MPCSDAGFEHYDNMVLNEKINTLTELLCEASHILSENELMNIASNDLNNWWKHHEAEDRKRRQKESEQRELRRIAEEAMRNLSPAQKEALGQFYGLKAKLIR